MRRVEKEDIVLVVIRLYKQLEVNFLLCATSFGALVRQKLIDKRAFATSLADASQWSLVASTLRPKFHVQLYLDVKGQDNEQEKLINQLHLRNIRYDYKATTIGFALTGRTVTINPSNFRRSQQSQWRQILP